MEKRRISFLGELLIIFVIVFFVFLFLNQSKENNVKEIILINEKHGVYDTILVPENTNQYYIDLLKVPEKEITLKLIDFIKLNEDLMYIENSLYRTQFIGEECISRDLKFRINSVVLKTNKLLSDFQEVNIKKYEKLNISEYINYLNNIKKKYTTYKIDSEKIPICS
jgi:hypothetical protein